MTYTIPNILSISRLALVPVLVALAYFGEAQAFLAVLAVSLLSDAFDGYIARKLNQTTELGARLDSWGDVLTYGAMILGLYWVWPEVFDAQVWFLVAALRSVGEHECWPTGCTRKCRCQSAYVQQC